MQLLSEEKIDTLIKELQIDSGEIDSVKKRIGEILGDDEDVHTEIIKRGYKKIPHIRRFWIHPEMWYRDYVGVHQERISRLISSLQYVFIACFGWDEFRFEYAKGFAAFHDDTEGISPFGDIPTPIKMNLSAESTRALHIIEIRCAHILAHHAEIIQLTPTENEELPEDTIYKRSREAKTVSLVDKIDGFMSCLHEVLAGNTSFREPFLNYITIFKSYLEDGNPVIKALTSLPVEKYLQEIWDTHVGDDTPPKSYEEAQSRIKELEELNDIDTANIDTYLYAREFFNLQTYIDLAAKVDTFLENPVEHTAESVLTEDYGVPGYMVWKRMIASMTGIQVGRHRLSGIKQLTMKRN